MFISSLCYEFITCDKNNLRCDFISYGFYELDMYGLYETSCLYYIQTTRFI